MAVKFHNGTQLEATVGSTAMHASNNTSPTTGGVTSATFTAPNTTNQATGVVIYINSVPNTSAVYTVELMESGVSKASATVSGADMKVGYCYLKWTPYTFTTTAAGAYAVKITSTLNSGTLASATSGFWYEVSYDSTSSPADGDDIIHCGFHNGGLTTKQWDIPDGTVFGSGAIKNLGSSVTRTMQAALMVGQGGTVKWDTAADCNVEIKGAIFPTVGGTVDKRANASNIEIVAKLTINCDVANGDYGVHLPPSSFNGRFLTDGMEVEHRAQYASGVGTAANPAVFQAAHGLSVNDEVIIPGTTYDGNQTRFVISIPSPTELVWSATLGGAESAITNSPAAGVWVGNLTRNSIVTAKTTTRGYYLYNNTSNSEISSFNYTRWEYASCASGPNLQFANNSTSTPPDINGMVGYRNSASGRTSWTISSTFSQEINDCILYETLGSNYVGQSGMALQSSSNKTINRFMHYALPGSTQNCAGLSLTSSATNNTINDSHFYGAGANNGSLAYAIGIIGSHGNTFNNCTVNNSRVRAIYSTDGFNNTFNNCNFGTVGSNLTDIFVASSSLATMVFSNCNFGSATRLANVANCLTGTDIAFQDIDGNQSKHGWETPNAIFDSSGAGLTDTTVRTAGSLALAIKPRNATIGGQMTFKIPAAPTSAVAVFGYIYRNSTFSSGDITVDLFLPGTLTTDTPDDTVTLSTTTSDWLYWNLNAYYSGSVARFATVRITAKTVTAGAYAFLDDIFDAQTGNKLAGIDLWDNGHIAPVLQPTDFASAIPSIASASATAVWDKAASAHTTAGTMGKIQGRASLTNDVVIDALG